LTFGSSKTEEEPADPLTSGPKKKIVEVKGFDP